MPTWCARCRGLGPGAHLKSEAEKVCLRQRGQAEQPEQRGGGGEAHAAELRQVEAAEAEDDACEATTALFA